MRELISNEKKRKEEGADGETWVELSPKVSQAKKSNYQSRYCIKNNNNNNNNKGLQLKNRGLDLKSTGLHLRNVGLDLTVTDTVCYHRPIRERTTRTTQKEQTLRRLAFKCNITKIVSVMSVKYTPVIECLISFV